jgi:putative RNA 2'-phosphotransferase
LYHGTATRFLESIQQQDLQRGKRDYVHLSPDEITAHKVGARHGEPIVLVVQAEQMHAAGFTFYCAANGVWLTLYVPREYLSV